MNSTRWDETWHRLRDWTNGQTPSERLSAQILLHEGFTSLEPSHPLGGPDGGKDAVCLKDGNRWIMAVYFPRGQGQFTAIQKKFSADVASANAHSPCGIAFVTNQELTLGERKSLIESANPLVVGLYHLERITAILDSPPMGDVRKQFLGIESEERPEISLGGQGGLAPGAGGGGGGALGTGSKGGDGGPGGKIIIQGSSGLAPGAGGGGGGIVGDNKKAGAGGGGGDQVHLTIEPEEFDELRRAGFERAEIRVGKGGRDGGPGEDSIVNFVTADGRILKSIVARGGQPGGAGAQEISSRVATKSDIESGLRVTTLTLADCVHLKNGLHYLLGAGWDNYGFPTIPFMANWPLACSIDTGSIEPGSSLSLSVLVKDPTGFQVVEKPFTVICTKGPVSRPNHVIPLSFTGSQAGVWSIEVVSGEIALGKLSIEIKGPKSDSD
ncbi:hypothetical protein [Opitutus sp. GAS368]|uniref:hypothetical protein n=1 Tax=Opitutus sp. GAS368 TaxID=1882749 RepID=UPI00087DAAE0|nr:hypothetical protein [Opitutus sp. GAS368]SDS07380.1 hypothetical protein SAMN05444173_1805 [Opitutus sp. GAS368]